jgi:hypothetical protein
MGTIADWVKVATATTGTGTITLGSAVRSSTNGDGLTFAEAGITDGETVSYFIQDGANRASGEGVYTASGTTLARDANEVRWNGTARSVAALSLSGSAVVYIGIRAADLFSGPASSTDNAIVRFDGTGGKTGQNSAATVDDDGNIRTAINSGSNPVVVPLTAWMMQTADRTLTSTTTGQKIFDTTTGGVINLPTGVYRWELFLYVTGLSATSGNFAIAWASTNSGVTGRHGWQSFGIDSTTPLNAGTKTGSANIDGSYSPASILTAATGTGAVVTVSGMFRVTTAGNFGPYIQLVTAAAGTVKAGTYVHIDKVGESSESYVGNWT